MTRSLDRSIRTFGRFWWDFLVGDTPELFVAMLALVGIAFSLRHERAAAVVLLPAVACLVLVASAWRGRVRTRAGADTGVQRSEDQ